jgi:hypothetical protein
MTVESGTRSLRLLEKGSRYLSGAESWKFLGSSIQWKVE